MLKSLQKQDIKSLHVFMAIAECQGLSAAQARLNMSQSLISTHLLNLESKLGFSLCYRGRSGFKLTEEGRKVYNAGLAFAKEADAFSELIKWLNRSQSQSLNIAIVDHLPFIFNRALNRTIGYFHQNAPDVKISLNILSVEEVTQSVLTCENDIGIGYFNHQRKELNYQQLLVEERAVYCHKSHPFFDRTLSRKELIEQATWVGQSYLETEDKLPVQPEKFSAFGNLMYSIMHFIFSGLYVGYLPTGYAQKWVDSGDLKMLLPEETKCFLTHHLVLNPNARKFQRSEFGLAFAEALKKNYEACWSPCR